MIQELKIITHPGGEKRVVVLRRSDGLYTYEEQWLIMAYTEELAERLQDFRKSWVPMGKQLTLCETTEAAEREARGAVDWLANTEISPSTMPKDAT